MVESQYVIASLTLLVPFAMMLGMVIYAWENRDLPFASPFFWLVAAGTGWLGSSVISFFTPPDTAVIFSGVVRYFFIAAVPVALFIFTLNFIGVFTTPSPWLVLCLSIVPLISLVGGLLNPLEFVQPAEVLSNGTFTIITGWEFGLWFWLLALTSYILNLGSIVLLIVTAVKSKNPRRTKASLLAVGAVFPIVVNGLNISGTLHVHLADATGSSFAFTLVLWGWVLLRYGIINAMPYARDVLFDYLKDAAIILDSKCAVLDANPAATEFFNRSRAELLDQQLAHLLNHNQSLCAQDIADSTESIEMTFQIDGQDRIFDVTVSTLKRRRQLQGYLVVLRDVTRQKHLIKDLEAYAHTVAHDLKNPIGTMIGYADLLVEMVGEEVPPILESSLVNIRESGLKMADIIDELLTLASITAVETVEMAPLNIPLIVDHTLKRLNHTVRQSQAVIDIPDEWPAAVGYAAWVEEILANYISNAIKYGGTPPQIQLGADQINGEVRFWVRDNGAGLSADEQEVVFEEFKRLNTNDAEGHGLGLSIVMRIARRMGSTVGVVSENGDGSTFYFTLPAAVPEEPR